MKRYFIALITLLLFITGCGNTKKLECSTDIYDFNQSIIVEYKEEEIKNVKLIMAYDAETLRKNNVTAENRDLVVSSMEKEVCSMYKVYQGINCTVTTPNSGMTITIEVDYPKTDQTAKDALNLNYKTYDELKSSFTETGYTCK